MMSTKVWDKLDPKIQNWVAEAASDSSTFQRKLWQEKTQESLEEARQADVTIYEVDTAAFAAKVAPMFDAIEDEATREVAKQIQEVR
jgi:TRAP-type C4-dicarboxylate transport system substrate-binding protein